MCEKPGDLVLTIDPLTSEGRFRCTRTKSAEVTLAEYDRFVAFLNHLEMQPEEEYIITFEKREYK